MSFANRIAVTAAIAVALAIVLASGAVYFVTSGTLYASVDSSLVEASRAPDIFIREVRTERGSRGGVRQGRFGEAASFVQVVLADGSIVAVPGVSDQLPVDDTTIAVATGTTGAYLQTKTVDGQQVRVYTFAPERGFAVQIARSVEEIDESLRRLRVRLLLIGLVGVGVAGALGAGVARGAVQPVRRLTETAETVARTQDLSHRIDIDGDDELGRLATTFNTMLANLDVARKAQNQLVADASHELRTPLTSLRTNIEVLATGAVLSDEDRSHLLRDVIVQLDEFGRLVTALVELARGDRPAQRTTEVQFDELVATVVQRSRAYAPDAEIVLDVEPSTVLVEADRVERAVVNLVDNAVKYGEGGTIDVEVRGGTLTVRDHGPGIDPDDLPLVFDRFYRAPAARQKPGSGLGLSIVQQVAHAHGGTVEVDLPEGGGARFRLHLPVATVDRATVPAG